MVSYCAVLHYIVLYCAVLRNPNSEKEKGLLYCAVLLVLQSN
jgi:hypothetical protein